MNNNVTLTDVETQKLDKEVVLLKPHHLMITSFNITKQVMKPITFIMNLLSRLLLVSSSSLILSNMSLTVYVYGKYTKRLNV